MDKTTLLSKPVLGGGALAVVGFFLAGPLGAAVGAGVGYLGGKKLSDMTPEQKRIYDAAMATQKDPVQLRALADAMEKQGFVKEATALRKRAMLGELPPPIKAARRGAYRAAMSAKDPAHPEALAEEFEKQGATGAAANLKKYAASLRRAMTP